MAYGVADRSRRLADGTGGSKQPQDRAPGKQTLTEQLSPSSQASQGTPGVTPTGPADVGVIVAERAAGRGDSDAAVRVLAQLLEDAGDAMALARAECLIATGAVESPISIQRWIEALDQLPADARAGYERALRSRGSMLTFAVALDKLRVAARQRTDAVAIVNAYRLAGRATDAAAVEQLAALLRANDRSIAAVEKLLGGVSTDVAIVDGNADTPADPSDAQSDDALLARLPADHAAAYRAALASLDGKLRSPRKPRTPRPQQTPQNTDTRSVPTSGIVASGGGRAGGGGRTIRVKAEAFEGIPDALENAHLAMLLLVASGVPADLAQWIATCSGEPPDRVRELENMKATMDASTPAGSMAPLPRRAKQEGGYHGYRIFNAAGQTMTTAEIDAALANPGYIAVSLDEAFYRENIAPLLESPQRSAWVRADLIAASYQREIDDLEERARASYAQSGRNDPALMQRILQLKGMRLQYATYAADLRSGKTSVTAQMGKFVQELRRLDALIADATPKLADAQKRLHDDLVRRRVELARIRPPSTGPCSIDDPVQSPELAREVGELDQYLAERHEERTATKQMMDAGDPFPDELSARRQLVLRQRFETTDGTFKFRSRGRASWNAADGAISSTSARVWAGIGGIEEYGGAVLSFLTREPWYSRLGDALSHRAYSMSAEIDVYAADRTAKAEEVLGKTATALIQVATSTAINLVMLGPVATAGGALGAAAIGGRIASTAGSMAALATTGALMSSDKGGDGMAKGALLMGVTPLFAGFGKALLVRAVSGFLGMAALDFAGQVDLAVAFTAYERTHSYGDALAAATAKVNFDRMFANGLMGALLAVGAGKPDSETALLRVGDQYFRPDGTEVTDSREIAATSKTPPVRVNEAELASIKEMQRSGNTEGALDLIARARTRGDAITETTAEAKKTGTSIAGLEAKSRLTAAEQHQLGDLLARNAQSQAQAEVLTAAQGGKPIPRALVERSGGGVPLGYAEATPGGDYVPVDGLAAEQSAQLRGQLKIASDLANQYRGELEEMNEASRELVAEQARAAPRSDVLTRLRASLTAAAQRARAVRAAFDRAVGRGDRQSETQPESPIVLDETRRLGGGSQGDVYAADVVGAPMAVKVPVGIGRPETALEGALLPTRYGGLGSGKIVKAEVNGVVVDAVLMPRVDGVTLDKATTVTVAQRDAFRGFMTNALKDAVVLADLNPSNIMLGKNGDVTVVDVPAVTPEKFAQSMREVLGDAATPERIAADWRTAREEFQWRVERTLREMESKLEGPPRSGGGTTVDTTPAQQRIEDTGNSSRVERTDARDVRPSDPPPVLDDIIIRDIAARTEADINNIFDDTCATAALRTTISAQLRGMKAYVVEIEGLTRLGRVLDQLGVLDGNVARILERLGADTRSAHAVAAIQGADGTWRYLSWGQVETDLAVFARRAYGDAYIQRGTWETSDHVQWMLAHQREYPGPTMSGRVERALFGWMKNTGK
jgi:hypothetical protein